MSMLRNIKTQLNLDLTLITWSNPTLIEKSKAVVSTFTSLENKMFIKIDQGNK